MVKAIDTLSYLVKYDLEGQEVTEYLHCLLIRPAVEHSPRQSEFRLGPGAAVEAYCDGAWSPGVVRRPVIRDGGYEVCINGRELLLNMLPELLKPQYKWNGKHGRIGSAKVIVAKFSSYLCLCIPVNYSVILVFCRHILVDGVNTASFFCCFHNALKD